MKSASNDGRMGPLTKALAIAIPRSLALAVVLFATLRSTTVPMASMRKVTIAVPMQISSATFFVAAAGGLFQKTGVEVITQPLSLGKDALQSASTLGRPEFALFDGSIFISGHWTSGLNVFKPLNRPKSRSALHRTDTSFSRQMAAIRAS